MLQCLGCLLPFLEHDLIDNLPYLTASSIAVLPTSLHQDVVNSLCFYILPFTIGEFIFSFKYVTYSICILNVYVQNFIQALASTKLPFTVLY